MSLTHLFTDKVQAMQAYHVPDSGGMIKLDAMESPYTLPPEMQQAMATAVSLASINRYPNPSSTSLIAKIKKVFELPDNCDVLLGNGSDELIQIILMATMRPGAKVLSPAPSFVMYRQTAELLDMQYIGVDLNDDFSLDEAAFLAALEKEQPAVTFLAYPNNPTGGLLNKAFVEQVMQTATGLVVVDEAYTAYAGDSVVDLIGQYDNAVLIRTVSKIGMAGLRLGYLVASPQLVSQFDKVRMPYNINVLTTASARFLLGQMSYIKETVDKIIRHKQSLFACLSAQNGLTVYDTQTNFLLVRVDDASAVYQRLRDEYKILVKNLHGSHPVLDNVLRITVGKKKDNEKLCQALGEILP